MADVIKVRFTGYAEVKPAYISLIGKEGKDIISGEQYMEMSKEEQDNYYVYRITHLPSHLVRSENFELERE